MVTDTIIEFVGLCVFTTQLVSGNATARIATQSQISNQTIVVAIMPKVPVVSAKAAATPMIHTNAPQEPASTATQRAAPGGPILDPVVSVEAHTAMLAFKRRDLLAVNGWAVKKLDDQGWVYVELSGEHLSFVPDAANSTVAPLPNDLPLHHLGSSTPLTGPYTPPQYSGAAAVFTISNGTLSACGKDSTGGTDSAPKRMDTTLTLHTAKNLTITADDGAKSVTLQAGALITAGNVPLLFAQTGQSSANAHDHYKVYCAMIGVSTCAPPWAHGDPKTDCAGVAFRPSGPQTLHLPAADFSCSNTQWP